jgi:hypothetical protein
MITEAELTDEELAFIGWMDDVDLEEVNLLDEPLKVGADAFAKEETAKLEDGEKHEPPPQRSLGWDTN